MKAADVMTLGAATVRQDALVSDAARLMLQYGISGLPVVDADANIVGVITEGDFLHHEGTGAWRQDHPWFEFLLSPGPLANAYVHSHSRRIDEVMTKEVVTVTEETPVEEIVRLMGRYRIKRVPVVRGKKVIGIVSRANLLRELARPRDEAASAKANDLAIREQILTELINQQWGYHAPIDITVRDGIVQLWGPVSDERVARALRVAAENIPGVKGVDVTTLPR
jgi:CBS domain-containing protein